MKRILLLSAILVASSAWATQPGNNGGGNGGCGQGQQTNGCGSTGGPGGQGGAGGSANAGAVGIGVGLGGAGGSSTAYGGKGGEGGSAAVVGSGNSSNRNENTNLGVNAQHQSATGGNATGGNQSQSNAASGYGGTAYGNGQGNSTSIDIAAPVIPKPAANSAYVGDLPQLPQGSCRLFIGGGATNRDGSATGMLPIGNDQTCLSTRSLEVMKQINASVGQVVFGKADMLDVACKIEGMDKLEACKK